MSPPASRVTVAGNAGVVLADDTGHRAVPIWLGGDLGALYLADLLDRPADQVITDGVPQELTTRLIGAARSRVTGVDIDVTEAGTGELSPEVTVARIGLAGPAGTRQVTAGLGLALAAAAGAPVRLADAVLDRLAVPVPGDDLLTPFLDRVPAAATARPRHGLPGWPLAPQGFAWLAQEIFADDYRGTSVTFRGQFRAPGTTGRTGLFLRVTQPQDIRGHLTARAALADPANHIVNLDGPGDWTTHEVTAPIPDEANTVAFGVFLAGPGRIELRNPELTRDGLA